MNNTATQKSVLTLAITSSFMTPFMVSSINVALPSIEREFKIDAVLLSWVATSYILASAIALVPFGKIADIYGRKRVFAFGMVTFTLSSLLAGLSISAPILILFRVFQGFGSAMIFATGIAILTSVFPPEDRGKVLGINVAAVYIGLSLGPFLGGLLTQHLTWRSIFLVNVPLGLIIICLVLLRVKGEWADAKGDKFDLVGSLIYCFAIVSIMYGISELPAMMGLWMVLSGFICIWAFVKWEMKVKTPVFELSLFRSNRVFAFSSLAALINYSATFAVTFLLSLYLQYIKEFSPQVAGFILISQPVVMAVFSPFAGRLSDRIEPRTVASTGMMFTAGSLISFTFISQNTSLAFIITGLMVLGLGLALFSSPNTNAIMSSVERRFYGIASGSVGTMRQLGMMISMGITTMLFAIYMGRAQITIENYPAFIESIKIAFGVFFILCVAGVFASLTRGKLRTNP